jgi:transcription initiation factor TFIIIB Brf1 subunit/transcription initiation factor TFIIB
MNGQEIDTLIRFGATDKARRHLKRLGMNARMKLLQDCIPNVNATEKSLKFFKENFSREIGALMMAEQDIDKAVVIYNNAKSMK